MSDDKKLPVSIQLVGFTAVLAFCLSAIGTFNIAQALWLRHETIASLEISNQIQIYLPLIIFATVCGASLFTLVALNFRTVRNAAIISIIYLILLLLFLAVQFISTLLASFELHIPLQVLTIWLGVRVLFAAWLVGLLAKVWPNYSFKRTGAERLR